MKYGDCEESHEETHVYIGNTYVIKKSGESSITFSLMTGELLNELDVGAKKDEE